MCELASAERPGHADKTHSVSLYLCNNCGGVRSLGRSCDPGWVSAKAEMFLTLREQAYRRAGMQATAARPIFNLETWTVLFATQRTDAALDQQRLKETRTRGGELHGDEPVEGLA
jgi:hypothetical protein